MRKLTLFAFYFGISTYPLYGQGFWKKYYEPNISESQLCRLEKNFGKNPYAILAEEHRITKSLFSKRYNPNMEFLGEYFLLGSHKTKEDPHDQNSRKINDIVLFCLQHQEDLEYFFSFGELESLKKALSTIADARQTIFYSFFTNITQPLIQSIQPQNIKDCLYLSYLGGTNKKFSLSKWFKKVGLSCEKAESLIDLVKSHFTQLTEILDEFDIDQLEQHSALTQPHLKKLTRILSEDKKIYPFDDFLRILETFDQYLSQASYALGCLFATENLPRKVNLPPETALREPYEGPHFYTEED